MVVIVYTGVVVNIRNLTHTFRRHSETHQVYHTDTDLSHTYPRRGETQTEAKLSTQTRSLTYCDCCLTIENGKLCHIRAHRCGIEFWRVIWSVDSNLYNKPIKIWCINTTKSYEPIVTY